MEINYSDVYASLINGETLIAFTKNGGGMTFKLFAANGIVIATDCGKFPMPFFKVDTAEALKFELCDCRNVYKIMTWADYLNQPKIDPTNEMISCDKPRLGAI